MTLWVVNAACANVVVCAEPGECCRPGTVLVPMGVTIEGLLVELEFCEFHAERRRVSVASR